MTTIQFLAEWALRSSILILGGALLLGALRVKDPSIRLAAWTMVLCSSLAIPALIQVLPKVPVAVVRTTARPVAEPAVVSGAAPAPVGTASRQGNAGITRFAWARAAVTIYVLGALALLLRLCVGLAMGARLLRGSSATSRETDGIEIRESLSVAAPVTLAIARPAIVLPGDWREWNSAKLDAVLAHERSHIRRHDPAVQLLSAIHRALLWYSPLSWFLHMRIVRTAEEASDDAALAVSGDRAMYAEVLLDFMRRGVRTADWLGVTMARYGRPGERIQRILDGRSVSRGVTRWGVAAILAMGSPLAYVVVAAGPQVTPQSSPPVVPATTLPGGKSMAPQVVAQSAPVFLNGLGNVAAFYTVTIKSRVDGQLMSVNFKEGDMVQAGQLLASIDPRPYELQLAEAEAPLATDQAQLDDVRRNQRAISEQQFNSMVAQAESRIKTDRARIDNAKLQLSYTRITAPISGIVGLRLVDPGNMVHAADANGMLIIRQLQPITVLFDIPEDSLPKVRARLGDGASPLVEAWNRDNTVKIATGRLTAVDNQIDLTTGTAKLKAVFDNKDGALFPNQFVNVHLFLSAR